MPNNIITYNADPEWVEIRKEIPMWTLSNIVTVAIIAAIVYKLMPKVTLRNFFKAVLKLIVRPFQRREIEIKREWDIAKKDIEK